MNKTKIEWTDSTWNPYIAGVFDGDGSAIVLTIKRPLEKFPFRLRPKILIAQKKRFILDVIREQLAIGSVIPCSFGTSKFVVFNYLEIQLFLNRVGRFSIIKKSQIELLSEFFKITNKRRGCQTYSFSDFSKLIDMRDSIHEKNYTTRNLKYSKQEILEANYGKN